MRLLLLLLLVLCSAISLTHGHKGLHLRAADAPAPAASNSSAAPPPKTNLIAVMSKKGCKTFADLVNASKGDVGSTFQDSIGGGLTVFCPTDDAMKSFMPKFKNLTANAKASLLLYHGVAVCYSLDSLKSSNGVMNTLATDGVGDYNLTIQNSGQKVTIQTAGPTATIKSTVIDKDPLAVYSVDHVLEPGELFKPAESPAPAPAPETPADAPKAGKGKKGHKGKEAPAPAGPDGQPAADQKAADANAGGRVSVRWWPMPMVVAAVIAAVA